MAKFRICGKNLRENFWQICTLWRIKNGTFSGKILKPQTVVVAAIAVTQC